MPVMVRNRIGRLGNSPNFPGPNGNPGSGIWPYSESSEWGSSGSGTQGGAVPGNFQPPDVGMIAPALDQVQQQSQSTPYGESARDWTNPTSYATVPILGSNSIFTAQTGGLPVLSLNMKRNSLIIQNQSSAVTAGDVAPTLYVGFNVQAIVGQSLALAPGLGFFWGASDTPPRDSIFITIGPYQNAGASVVIAGCIVQGTYTPNSAPYVPQSYGTSTINASMSG
jgi:hypothetical protein